MICIICKQADIQAGVMFVSISSTMHQTRWETFNIVQQPLKIPPPCLSSCMFSKLEEIEKLSTNKQTFIKNVISTASLYCQSKMWNTKAGVSGSLTDVEDHSLQRWHNWEVSVCLSLRQTATITHPSKTRTTPSGPRVHERREATEKCKHFGEAFSVTF